MERPKVILVVSDAVLRETYDAVLRQYGVEPVAVTGEDLGELPEGTIAGCILTRHDSANEPLCTRLLAAAVPVIRIDPFIRHTREHLPFDVVLPVSSEPRELITALRHLVPNAAHSA